MNGYAISRAWWDFAFANPEKVKPIHSALLFFAIEHCNRLGWKPKFGLPSQMAMEAIGIGSYTTYIPAFNDLCEWGFFELVQKSKNQYSSNIIALSIFDKAPDKALDKALIKHGAKQRESIDSINKQETKEQIYIPEFTEFLQFAIEQISNINKDEVKLKYESWKVNNWKDGNNKQIKNWKTKLLNTLPYISKIEVKQPRQIFD